jgi:hypothetical protein
MQKVDYEKLKKQLDANEEADFNYQERRHSEWTENNQLYRDKVLVNRLTQRQSINVPLIKGVIKTVQANTDEFPDIEFDELGNDKDKEIAFNELWKDFVITDRLEIKDVVDKKQDFLYGKTWTKFNLVKGRITTEIKEPFDILVDRFADPTDYDNTADHLSEHGIYRTLGQLSENPMFDQAAVRRLKNFYATRQGLIKSEETTKLMQAKNERMAMMGVGDIDNPQLGTTVVELKADFQNVYDLKDMEQHLHLIVRADNEILMAKPLKELLNVDFFPFVSWSDDPERNDHYPDGIADIARTPNKLLNAMISALAENRILRNFGMNFYDSSLEGFVPQTYQPAPFGWYGMPVPEGKNIKDIFQPVQIPDMSDSLDEMEYVKKLVETAVAANSTVQGETQAKKVTLGEVELAMAASKERISSIAKFYMLAQKEKGDKWAKIMNANADKIDAITLYKKSHKGNYFEKTVTGKDWKSEKGYMCRAVSTAERDKKNLEGLQKLNAVKAQFPTNMAMNRIYGEKVLQFAELNNDQVKEVMEEEAQKMQTGVPGMPPDAAGGAPQPAIPQVDPNMASQLTQPNAIPA